jgi:hypothetical protein
LQIMPPVHAAPHAPQLAASVAVSTHTPAQRMSVPVHAHWPARHVALVPHGMPSAMPVQSHAPAVHATPGAHAFPQAPQCAASLATFAQLPLQLVIPVAQSTPPTQLCPVEHVALQVPQCAQSVVRSTQLLPQRVRPAPQRQPGSMQTGVSVVRPIPLSPSCAYWFAPKHATVPLSRIAHVAFVPSTTLLAPCSAGTSVGIAHAPPGSQHVRPCARPQQYTSALAVRPHTIVPAEPAQIAVKTSDDETDVGVASHSHAAVGATERPSDPDDASPQQSTAPTFVRAQTKPRPTAISAADAPPSETAIGSVLAVMPIVAAGPSAPVVS